MRHFKHLGLVVTFLGVWFSGLITGVHAGAAPRPADHGVILLYHHVSESTPASTSISPQAFIKHLEFIEAQGFTVWPLTRLVKTLKAGQSVPDNVIAITFDDAYASVYQHAWPELKRRGWPFTVFVNTQAIGNRPTVYMSWSQLQAMAAAGVTMANHSHSHSHLLSQRQVPDWEDRVRQDIVIASETLEKHVGPIPALFAYPYGEFSPQLQKVIGAQGLLAFGQHSGAIGHNSDFLALPRFPMGGAYTSVARLQTALNSRPLNIHVSPHNGLVLAADTQSAQIKLTVDEGNYNLSNLTCYAGDTTRLDLTRQGPGMFNLVIKNVVSSGRHKINCTVADLNRPSEYYWWSFIMMKKPATADWYAG